MKRLRAFIIILFTLVFCTAMATHATSASIVAKKNVPTNITSDSMEYSANSQTVTFKGNVYVKRLDFELRSKTLTVYLKKEEKNDVASTSSGTATSGMKAGDVDYLVAEGNVRMKSEEKRGECQKATYYTTDDKIVMEGSPKLFDADNRIEGRVITHFIEKNYSKVDGGVNASFQTLDSSKPD